MANNSSSIINRYKKYITDSQRKKLTGLYRGYRQTTADEMREQYLNNRRAMGGVRSTASAYGLGQGYINRKQFGYDRTLDTYGRQLAAQADSQFEQQVVNAANETIDARNKAAQEKYRKQLAAAEAANRKRAKQQAAYDAAYAEYQKALTAWQKNRDTVTKRQNTTERAPVTNDPKYTTTPTHVNPYFWSTQRRMQYTDTGTGNNSYARSKALLLAAQARKASAARRAGAGTTKGRSGANNAGGKLTGISAYTDTGTGSNKGKKEAASVGKPTAPVYAVDPEVKLPVQPQDQAKIDAQVKQFEALPPEQKEQAKVQAQQEYVQDVATHQQAVDRLAQLQQGNQNAQAIIAQFNDLAAKAKDTRYSEQQRRGFTQQMSGLQRQYASVIQNVRGNSQEISGLQRLVQRSYNNILVKRGILGGMGVKYSAADVAYDASQGFIPATPVETYKQTVSLNNSTTDTDKEFWKRAKHITPAFHEATGEMVIDSTDRNWFEQHGYGWILDGVTEHIKQQDRHYASFAEAAREYLTAKEEREWKYYALKDVNRLKYEIAGLDPVPREYLLKRGEAATGLTIDNLPTAKEMEVAEVQQAATGAHKGETAKEIASRISKALGIDKSNVSETAAKSLVEDEAALAYINYCYALGRTQQAQDFLYDYSELANAVFGKKVADSAEASSKAEVVRAALEFMMQFGYGSSTFFEGLENLFTDKRKPQSWGSYMTGDITQNRIERGWNPGAATAVGDATVSAGNNITAMLIGRGIGAVGGAIGGIAAEVASHAPSALMGLSAAGNAKQQALREGYGAKAATMYGIINGLSEAVLQEKIGGLVGFGDRGMFTKALAKAVDTIKSPLARTLINAGLDVASEVGQELFGNIVDSVNNSLTLGKDTDVVSDFKEQFGQTAASTIISTLMLNSLGFGGQLKREVLTSRVAKAAGISVEDAHFMIDTYSAIAAGQRVSREDLEIYNGLSSAVMASMPDNVVKAINEGKMTVVDWLGSKEGQLSSRISGKLNESDTETEAYDTTDHTAKLKGKTDEQRRDYLLNAAPTGKVGNAYYTTADGKAIQFRNLNTTQKANYVLAQKCAKAFAGSVDIVIHDTLPLSNGAMVGSDGKLHIALDTTNAQGRESIAYWTLTHESGHALKIADSKAWDEMFNVLTDYAKKYEDRDGKNLYDALVDSITNQYKYDNDSDAFNDEMFSLIAERMVGSEGEQWAATLGDNTIFDAIAKDRNASAKAKRGFLGKMKNAVEKLSRQFRDGGFSKERKHLAKICEQLTEAYKRINEAPSIRDAAVAREVERKAHEEARKIREQTERREGFREGLKAHDEAYRKEREAKERQAREDALLDELLNKFADEDRIKAEKDAEARAQAKELQRIAEQIIDEEQKLDEIIADLDAEDARKAAQAEATKQETETEIADILREIEVEDKVRADIKAKQEAKEAAERAKAEKIQALKNLASEQKKQRQMLEVALEAAEERAAELARQEVVASEILADEAVKNEPVDEKTIKTLWSHPKNNSGWKGKYGTATEALTDAIKAASPALWSAYYAEGEGAQGKGRYPLIGAVTGITEDVRQGTISPMAAATALNALYTEFGATNIDGDVLNDAGNAGEYFLDMARAVDANHSLNTFEEIEREGNKIASERERDSRPPEPSPEVKQKPTTKKKVAETAKQKQAVIKRVLKFAKDNTRKASPSTLNLNGVYVKDGKTYIIDGVRLFELNGDHSEGFPALEEGARALISKFVGSLNPEFYDKVVPAVPNMQDVADIVNGKKVVPISLGRTETAIDAKLLLDVLQLINPEEMRYNSSKPYAPYYAESDAGRAILLPVRINTEKGAQYSVEKDGTIKKNWDDGGSTRHSLRTTDTEYLSLAEKYRDGTATEEETAELEKAIAEAAKEAEYNSPKLYHGTRQFGFTVFNPQYSDDKLTLFFTSSKKVASTYSNTEYERRVDRGYSAKAIQAMTDEELVKKINAEVAKTDDAAKYGMMYSYYTAKDINDLGKTVRERTQALKQETAELISEYADKLATDFNDADARTHRQLVQVYEAINKGDYGAISTPLFLLLNHTNAYKNNKELGKLESEIRLLNMLYLRTPEGGAFVQSMLDGYDLEIISREAAEDKLLDYSRSGNYGVYAKLGNSFVVDANGSLWRDIKNWNQRFTTSDTRVLESGDYYSLQLNKTGKILKSFEKTKALKAMSDTELHNFLLDTYNEGWRIVADNYSTPRDIAKTANRLGYDSVIIKNVVDPGGLGNVSKEEAKGDIYIVFNGNQVKSADPVTYDDNGDIIPLSERFNADREGDEAWKNEDIRYSLKNTQTMSWDEQMKEYFSKNHGKLKSSDVLYVGNSGNAYKNFGMDDRPVGMGQFVVNKAMRPQKGSRSAHGLSEKAMRLLGKGITNPVAVADNPSRNCVYVFTGDANDKGEPVVAIIGKNTPIDYAEAHRISSVYAVHDPIAFLRDHIPQNSRIEVNKKTKLTELLLGNGVPYAELGTILGEFADVIVNDSASLVNPVSQEISSASLTDDRISDLIKEYGASGNYAKAYVTSIDPRDFLRLTVSDDVLDKWNAAEGKHEEIFALDEDKLRSNRQTPYLNINHETGEVEGHEGRHRMRALWKAGITSVPIAIVDTANKYGKTVTDKMTVSSQDFGEGSVNGGYSVTLRNLIPTNEQYREQITRDYGGEAKIRYQQRDFRIDFNVPQLDTKALHEAVKGGEGTVENRFEVKYEKTDSGFAVHITDKDSGKTYDRAETAPEGSEKAEAERAAAAVIRNIKRGEQRKAFREYADKREADARLAERMHEGAIRARIERKAGETEQAYKERIKKIYEDRYRREIKNTALKWNKKLVDMLARPTENKHVPVQLARSVAEFCEEVTKYLDGTTKRGEKILDKIRKAYDRAFTDEQTILRAKSEDADFDARGAVLNSAQKDEQLAEMLKALSDITAEKSFAELTRDEMDALLNVVRGVAHTVTDANRMIGEAEGKAIWEVGNTIVNEMESAPKVPKRLRGYLESSLDLRRLVRIFNGSNENAAMVKLADELNRGAIEKERVAQELQSIFKPVTDKYGDEIRKWYGKKAVWLDTGIVKDGMPVKITKGMRVSLALHVLNEGNMRHIERGGLTIPNAELYAKGKLADAYANGKLVRLTAEQINDIIANMTEAEKAYVEAAKQLFHDRAGFYINKTSLQLAGYTKANVENYFPIHTDKNFTKTDFASMIQDGSIEGQGFLKERVKASNPVYLEDITSVVNRQIRGVALYAGLAIPVRNFNSVMNAAVYEDEDGNWVPLTTVKQTVKKEMGDYGAKVIEDFVKDASEMTHVDVTPGERFIGKLAGNYVKAVLLGNAKVAMKQVASYPTAAAVIPWKYLGKALLAGGKNHRIISRADVDLINKYTPLYQMRREGNANELASIMNKPGMEQKLPWLLGWITKMDVMTVGRLWSAAEYMVDDTRRDLAKGTDEYYKAVAEVFNKTIQETQPNFTPLQRSAALRSKNPIVRSLTLFGTQRMQNGGILIEAATELLQSKGKSKAEITAARNKLGRAVASQVTQGILLLIATFAVDALRGRMKQWQDDDKELTLESIGKKMGDTFLSNFVGSFLGGSELYSAISGLYKNATGKTAYDTEFSIPAIDAVETIVNFAQNDLPKAISYLTGDHTDEEKMNKLKNVSMELAKVAGYASGLPLENAIKDVFKGIIPAIKDLRDYKKSNELLPWLWQSGKLDSKKTRERYEAWLDSGHKGSQFFKVDKALKGVGKRDDRAEVLNGMDDLTPEDKALLMEMFDTSEGYADGARFYNKNGKFLYDFADFGAEGEDDVQPPAEEAPAAETSVTSPALPASNTAPAATAAPTATPAPDPYQEAIDAGKGMKEEEFVGYLGKSKYSAEERYQILAKVNKNSSMAKNAQAFHETYKLSYDDMWDVQTRYNSSTFHGTAFHEYVGKKGVKARQKFALVELANGQSAWLDKAVAVNQKMGISYDILWKLCMKAEQVSGRGKTEALRSYAKSLGLTATQFDKINQTFKFGNFSNH